MIRNLENWVDKNICMLESKYEEYLETHDDGIHKIMDFDEFVEDEWEKEYSDYEDRAYDEYKDSLFDD